MYPKKYFQKLKFLFHYFMKPSGILKLLQFSVIMTKIPYNPLHRDKLFYFV